MKVRKKISSILMAIIISVLGASSSFAGDKGGNGGVILDCDGKLELADFWEARTLHKHDSTFSILESSDPMEGQISAAFKKLTNYRASQEIGLTASELFNEYIKISSTARMIPHSEVYWEYSDDVGLFKKIPDGCRLDNVVHYLRTNYVDVRMDYYHRLTETQKAALWVHEVLYKKLRDHGEIDSHISRRLTAFLFSNMTDSRIASGLILKFLSNKKVIFLSPKNEAEKLVFKLIGMEALRDNYLSHFYSVSGLLNPVKKCETKKTTFGIFKKEVCRDVEGVKQNDYDVFIVSFLFIDTTGTWVRYSSRYSISAGDELIERNSLDIKGTIGVSELDQGYTGGHNMLYLNIPYYVLSEQIVFDYIYGRN